MKFFYQIIEQLFEAGNQIDKGTSTGSRLALILTDNVLELLMYQIVRDKFSYDDIFNKIGKSPKYSEKIRTKVLNHFPDKTIFINKNIEIISTDQVDIINICHKFRNEAYHENISRDTIIHQVTKTYFQTCCELVPKLWSGSISVQFPVESYLIRFLSQFGLSGDGIFGFSPSREAIEKAINTICKNRKCSQLDLSNALSKDIVNRIKKLNEMLDYLDSNSDNKPIPYDSLTLIQFWEEHHHFRPWKEFDALISSYKPKITKSKIKSWGKRGKNLINESFPGKVLSKYHSIDSELKKKSSKLLKKPFQTMRL